MEKEPSHLVSEPRFLEVPFNWIVYFSILRGYCVVSGI